MARIVDPSQQTIQSQVSKFSNFKFMPNGFISPAPVTNITNIYGSDNTLDDTTDVVENDTETLNEVVDIVPIVSVSSKALPDDFQFTLSEGTIVTDAAGNQTISVDVICPALYDAELFEVRLVAI